ncbi:MarR family winged helix-turn-helix transcriptional regulator [Chloroflexota bacterium]
MAKEEMPKDELYDIWWLISQVHHSLLELRNRELEEYNITGWQASVLLLVKLFGREATPTNLSYWIFRKPNTISELLGRMERQGLVERIRDLEHRGKVRIALTEKGEQAYNQAAARASVHKAMEFLSIKEREALISCLRTIRDNIYSDLGITRQILFP